jgi:hypothetical protein
MAKLFTSKSICVLALLIGACAPSPVGPGLQALKGQDIRTAINYLGYPDRKQTIVGDTVYIWMENGSYTSTYPITDYDEGEFEINGQRGTYSHRNRSYVSEFNTYSCKIKVATDDRDIIKSAQATSSQNGCSAYNAAFEQILYDLGQPQGAEKLEN